MNWILLGLTIFSVIFVVGMVFWLISILGPIRQKQAKRRQDRADAQRRQSDAS